MRDEDVGTRREVVRSSIVNTLACVYQRGAQFCLAVSPAVSLIDGGGIIWDA